MKIKELQDVIRHEIDIRRASMFEKKQNISSSYDKAKDEIDEIEKLDYLIDVLLDLNESLQNYLDDYADDL